MRKMKSLIILLLMFIFPAAQTEAALSSILGNNLIDQTCKQTPYYDLCIWSLITNPHGFNTDVNGLAKIMVYTIEAKATHALNCINYLIEQQSWLEPKMQESLRSCADRYNAIIKEDCPEAIEALRSGDYKFAEKGTYDAATEAMSCEEEFSGGRSPVADMNMVVHDVSVVAASIVKIIISN